MRAIMLYGAWDVQVEDVPDPVLEEPTDAIVRVLQASIGGTDLYLYHTMPRTGPGTPMGREFLGVVEELGSEVRGMKKGDLVVAPFTYQDNTCDFCREGLQTSCRHGGFFNTAQAELIRVPQATGTLITLPVGEDSALLPSLLTLADAYSTGYYAAKQANVNPDTTVTVIGDGAVGLLAVLSASRLGAKRIILTVRHETRTELGNEFGATAVVAEHGADGVARVRELTDGDGTHVVLEAVGYRESFDQALGMVRPGGVISRVGVQYDEAEIGWGVFGRNITLTGGPAPVQAIVDELLPGILDGAVEPGKVFDHTVGLDEVPDGYQAMSRREVLKVLIRP